VHPVIKQQRESFNAIIRKSADDKVQLDRTKRDPVTEEEIQQVVDKIERPIVLFDIGNKNSFFEKIFKFECMKTPIFMIRDIEGCFREIFHPV
jgi:hypothetical protein